MKTTKIILNYGNSACIPTGVPYEQIKPFYNLSEEIELSELMLESEIRMRIRRLKDLVDGFIADDFKKHVQKKV